MFHDGEVRKIAIQFYPPPGRAFIALRDLTGLLARLLAGIPSHPSFVNLINVKTLIAADHPIRPIKRLGDEVLRTMSGHCDEIDAQDGAPSVPPEMLLKGKVLPALHTVRSERQLCARLQTDLLFRWFVDLALEAEVFDASPYRKNQERMLAREVADLFFAEVVECARRHGWVSHDHFSVDATPIEAWAALKSFKPKDSDQGPGRGNPAGISDGLLRRCASRNDNKRSN